MSDSYWTGYDDGRASASGGMFDVILNVAFLLALVIFVGNYAYSQGLEDANAEHQDREAIHKRLDRIEAALGTREGQE